MLKPAVIAACVDRSWLASRRQKFREFNRFRAQAHARDPCSKTAGEPLQLVQAGNHCQGAVFLDGDRLLSNELERTIDDLSTSIQSFFVGRYDVRYASEEGLRMGRDFKIVELNGASAEPNIYDPDNSLRNAYRTLFRHWEIIFAIADENRRRGVPYTSLTTIWRNWSRYRERSAHYPVSD